MQHRFEETADGLECRECGRTFTDEQVRHGEHTQDQCSQGNGFFRHNGVNPNFCLYCIWPSQPMIATSLKPIYLKGALVYTCQNCKATCERATPKELWIPTKPRSN